jgi:hypothetical protein
MGYALPRSQCPRCRAAAFPRVCFGGGQIAENLLRVRAQQAEGTAKAARLPMRPLQRRRKPKRPATYGLGEYPRGQLKNVEAPNLFVLARDTGT